MTYTIKRLERDVVPSMQIKKFIYDVAVKVNEIFGNKYNWKNFPVQDYINRNYIAICFRGDEPVGLMAGSLSPTIFDKNVIILKQNLLYALPNTRASYHLLKDFIDFGKVHANHIITTIHLKTNIKPSSLQKLGFEKLEENYRLEIS